MIIVTNYGDFDDNSDRFDQINNKALTIINNISTIIHRSAVLFNFSTAHIHHQIHGRHSLEMPEMLEISKLEVIHGREEKEKMSLYSFSTISSSV